MVGNFWKEDNAGSKHRLLATGIHSRIALKLAHHFSHDLSLISLLRCTLARKYSANTRRALIDALITNPRQ